MLVNIGKNSVNPSYVEQVTIPYELLLGDYRMVVHMQSGLEVEEIGTKEALEKAYDELLYYCNNRKARDNGTSYSSTSCSGPTYSGPTYNKTVKKRGVKTVLRARSDKDISDITLEDDKWDSEMMI